MGDSYAPGLADEAPLLPRGQRRQRRALRGVLSTLVVVALLVVAGWYFRDTIQGFISPTPPTPTVVAQEPTATDDNAGNVAPASSPVSGMLPNALATVTPTPQAAATATAKPQPTAAAQEPAQDSIEDRDRDISAQTQPLLEFLPTQEQVPPGMVLADEAERSKAEVAAALGGTEEANVLLDDWGWSGNAYREFVVPQDAAPGPGGTTFLNVSVHRFADADSAAKANIFFSDQVVLGQGLQEVEAPAIGDSARLLIGEPDGVPLAVLYVQSGPIMYRIGGSSANADSDPTSDVLAVAQAIVPSPAGGG